ncbi:MAG: alpha/beta hydrolase [Myxococcales bacterium]|nr:alpha/beta hydrolase [Myxococcales bacterium]
MRIGRSPVQIKSGIGDRQEHVIRTQQRRTATGGAASPLPSTAEMVKIYSDVTGDGVPLLLMHGFAGSARNFRPQGRAFADAYRTIVFDARGHGRSEAPEEPSAYSVEHFVEDARRVLDRHGAPRAVIGGLSMGAAIALAFARAHPDRVRALVLASVPAGRGSGQGVAAIAKEFAELIETRGLEIAGERYVWGERSGLDEATRPWVRQGFLEHAPHGLAHTLRGVIATLPTWAERPEALADLDIPALVVAGSLDPPSRRAGEIVARALPQGRFVCIEGGGHVVNLSARVDFNHTVRAFLEGHAPSETHC